MVPMDGRYFFDDIFRFDGEEGATLTSSKAVARR